MIEINKTYYFNNRPVKVLREESENFVFVEASLKLDHDITGSNFCGKCNTDGYYTHTCDVAGEIIDAVMDEIQDSECFWVAKTYLREHPFEYKENVKLKEENSKLISWNKEIKEEIEVLKATKDYLESDVLKLQEQETKLEASIKESESELEIAENKKEQTIKSLEATVKVKNSTIEISGTELLELLKARLELQYLDNAGVDNWEWYSEAFNDVDLDEEALEEFRNL